LCYFFAVYYFTFLFIVEKRQTHLEVTAAKSNALVNSLFPDQVREQLLKEADNKNTSAAGKSQAATLETEANYDPLRPHFLRTKPIAELFPETTIMFADIVGFTAWSSAREPAQVFTLLETIYHNFDMTANKLGIFKVETIWR
jgi:class 3 adenylate cyclase